MSKFKPYPLKLIDPSFGSPLIDLIMELEHLRRRELYGSTHPSIFFQMKKIFHMLESLGSARIEGNRTTIAELVEVKLGEKPTDDEAIREIQNMEEAMDFIDKSIKAEKIDRRLISELHKKVVEGLSPEREGDRTPGLYRSINVQIKNADHLPPDVSQVQSYMEELFEFINRDVPSKYDLLKIAIAHHRFVWVHPFRNGNGRTVRLLTYAMLVKQGFRVDLGRLINPTAVFCNDRGKYHENLSKADSGTEDAILNWSEYVLGGLKTEIEKIDKLLDYKFLSEKILEPALKYSLERKIITDVEFQILKVAVQEQCFQAANVKKVMPARHSADIARLLRRLREKKMIKPIKEKARKYCLRFSSNMLLRGVVVALNDAGFLPKDM